MWYNEFEATDCLCDAKRTGRPGPSAESLNRVRGTFARSHRKSTRRATREYQIWQPSVWRILRKTSSYKTMSVQLLQALNPQDYNHRTQFHVNFQVKLQEDGFAEEVIFSYEATFFVSGKVNSHNVLVWDTRIRRTHP